MPESFDLTIRGGTVVTGRAVRPATIAIRDGRIAALMGNVRGATCDVQGAE